MFTIKSLFVNFLFMQIAELQLQNIENKNHPWVPAENCPWGKNDEKKPYEKCDRGQINLQNFRSELKSAFYKRLKGKERIHETRIEPVVVKSNYSDSLFCVIDKCGSTAWKRVIQKAMGATQKQVLRRGLRIHNLKFTRIGDLPPQEAEQMYTPQTIRWMIVRNPYARVFSSYYEKLAQGRALEVKEYQKMFNLYKFQKDNDYHPPTFEEFIHQLYSFYNNGTWWNSNTQRNFKSLSSLNGADRHFDLQTSRCGMPQGFGYDYVLKSELIQEWYSTIIQVLNFTDVVMSGWPKKNQCFLSTPQMECDGPTLGGSKNVSNAKDQLHTLKSKDHMLQAYNPQIAAMVTEMYMPDLIGLNYPIWDGNPNTFQEV